jgi:hypothetical protein
MRKIIFLFLFIIFTAMPNCIWADTANGPSKEIGMIINELKNSDVTLDVSRFSAVESKNIAEDPLKGDYDQYSFPSVEGFDMYHYVVKFDKKDRRFWIWRTGGFAYSNILYGPGYLNNEGKIEVSVK